MPYLDWHRDTRKPAIALPADACDCSIHVFGPPGVGRLQASRRYDPLPATIDDLARVHDTLGVKRAVLVQASIYGNDHTVLLDALRRRPDHYRGIAAIDDNTPDSELAQLHDAGVRGARFNMLSRSGARFDAAALAFTAARCESMGWSLSLHGGVEDFLAHQPALRSLRLPVIVDNLAYLDPAAPGTEEAMAFFRDRLDSGHWWMKIARVDLKRRRPYDDTLAPVQRIVAMCPERMLWGSDWPHVLYDSEQATMPEDAELLELFARQVPDAAVRDTILRDNPARLFGFPN
ncbi:MAG: amidohydrolase family protein [Hydrogenophaga sp.]|nr:amidohydrolase family protein [Hydrogenophaga sp.]